MLFKKLALAGAVTVLSATTALAGCGLSAGNVNILGNDFGNPSGCGRRKRMRG